MIRGVNHITLSIKHVQTSFDFYTRVLGAQPIARWHKGAYVLLGDVWVALVLDEKMRRDPLPEYSHLALTLAPEDFPRE